MTEMDVERALYAFRCWLADRGIAADDLDERGIVTALLPALADAVTALGRCTLPVASWDKRFVKSLAASDPGAVTFKQVAMVCKLRHKYRRQAGPSPLPRWWEEYVESH